MEFSTLKSDCVFKHSPDSAYMALLDLASYDKDMPDWDYGSLTRKIATQMKQERIFAWGCPEENLHIRITRKAPTTPAFRPVESVTGLLTTSGKVAFTSYNNLTMCAQFEDYRFPQPDDYVFVIEPGRYAVAVHRMFE